MDHTQLGRAGELALALYALVTSDGEIQLYTPVADDDHTDATAGRRGRVPAIAIQVKTYRLPPLELGARLLQIIDAQTAPLPLDLRGPGATILAARRA